MKKNLYYYMSGTGNSYRTAVWAGESTDNGLHTDIIPMESKAPIPAPAGGTITGLFFPTHGFTAPMPAIRFALRMPRVKKSHVFIIATRAGAYYGPWPLPGMEGTACLVISLILFFKGYDVRGFAGMDMPSNWLVVHWGMTKEHSRFFYDKTSKEMRRFVASLLSGKRVYRSLPSWIMGLLLAQVSFMYLLAARLMLAKVMFADENCTGCGVCAVNCPYEAIRMAGPGKKKPYWTFSCESCERCIAYCPERAIQGAHSYLFILFWLMYGLLAGIPVYLKSVSPLPLTGFWETLFSILYTLFFLYLGHIILTLLTRIKPVAWLFSHTTLTKIFPRYHQTDTKLSDLRKKRP